MFPLPIIKPYVAVVSEYDRFNSEMQTAIQSGTVSKISNPNSAIDTSFPNKTKFFYNYIAADPANIMYGSPYTTFFSLSSGVGRMAQHAIPPSVYNWYVANQGAMYFELSRPGSSLMNSITRNGYTSYSSGGSAFRCALFVYYDNITGYMMQYNPNSNTTPTRYYP